MGISDEEFEALGAPKKALSDEEFEALGAPVQSAQPPERTWSSVPLEAVRNIPTSAARFASDIVQPFLHPAETGKALYHTARGAYQKLGAIPGEEDVQYADAVGQFFRDRYGSVEAAKNALATDPIGVAADLSTVLTGGAAAAARTPALAGRAAEITGTVGRALDPVATVGKAVTLTGKGAANVIGGIGTHTGGESLQTAARAGFEGGQAAKVFREEMRGAAPAEAVVQEAKDALNTMQQQRGTVYRDAMASHVATDPTVLDFKKIDYALQNAVGVQTYGGRSKMGPTQVLNAKTAAIRDEINAAVMEWKGLDPVEFHTAEGIDALKRKIGDIRDATAYGTPERVVADKAYNAIKQTIVDQVPEYAKIMKGYEMASDQIREIEKTLSINPNASIDTSLRKLQSILRHNVNTNYGRRRELADYLINAGAPHLMERLSGQILSGWTPRGLGKLGAQIAAEMAAASFGVGGPHGALAVVPTLPLMSPRLMGEAAYYTGRGAGAIASPTGMAARLGFQPGRAKRAAEEGFAAGGAVGKVNRSYDVPFLSGPSKDGKVIYIDRRLPARLKIKRAGGKGYVMIDPALPLSVHERAEQREMEQLIKGGMSDGEAYKQAHTDATAVERRWVEQHGLDWKHYEEVMDGYIRATEHENPKRPPPNLYLKPYSTAERLKLNGINRADGGGVDHWTTHPIQRIPDLTIPDYVHDVGETLGNIGQTFQAHKPDVIDKIIKHGRRSTNIEDRREEGVGKGKGDRLDRADGGSVKISKEEARYVDKSQQARQRCAMCSMFKAPNQCTAVTGPVKSAGWCKLFERKK